jgi:hypothetical protein
MKWMLIDFSALDKKVRCGICAKDAQADEPKVRLNPVQKTPKTFFYYHRRCFSDQLQRLRDHHKPKAAHRR